VTITEVPKGSLNGRTAETDPSEGTIKVDVSSIEQSLDSDPGTLVDVLIIVVEHEIQHTPQGGDPLDSEGGYNREPCAHLKLGGGDIDKIATLLCDATGSAHAALLKMCKAWRDTYNKKRQKLKFAGACGWPSLANFPPKASPCACPD